MQFQPVHHRLLRQRRFRQILFGSMIFSVIVAFCIVPIERMSDKRTINTFSDGLWWAVQTVTTVGYGDVTPVTEAGRALGIIMQILGTLMFGTLIAMISSSMSRNQEEMYWSRLFDRLDTLSSKIEKVEHQTRYLVKAEAEVEESQSNLS